MMVGATPDGSSAQRCREHLSIVTGPHGGTFDMRYETHLYMARRP